MEMTWKCLSNNLEVLLFDLYTICIDHGEMEHLLDPSISLLLHVYMLQVKVCDLRCPSSTLANTPRRSGIELCTGVKPSHTCTVLCNLSYSHI